MADSPERCYRGHKGPVFVARLSHDGQYAMSGGQDKLVHLWNPHRGDPDAAAGTPEDEPLVVRRYETPHGYRVQDIALTQDSGGFSTCGGEKLAFVWDVRQGKVVRKLLGHEQHLNAIAYAANDSVLLTASYDGTAAAWDLKSHSQRPIQRFSEANDSVMGVVAHEHTIVTSSVDGCVRTYDLRMGSMVVDSIGDPVARVSVSNDGNCLLTASLDHTLRLLDRSTGDVLCEYTGHTNASYSVDCCLSNDDALVVAGSEDGVVRLWDLVEGTVQRRLEGHRRTVCSIAVHRTQPMLLSGSYDGTVGVWRL